MRNYRTYDRRYRRPAGSAAFLSDHLGRHPVRTVLLIGPMWVGLFATISIGVFELAVNLFCMHVLGMPFRLYTSSSLGQIGLVLVLLGGRSAPEAVESVLLIGATGATVVCWFLFRSDRDLD